MSRLHVVANLVRSASMFAGLRMSSERLEPVSALSPHPAGVRSLRKGPQKTYAFPVGKSVGVNRGRARRPAHQAKDKPPSVGQASCRPGCLGQIGK
jgi:hypothetical protein